MKFTLPESELVGYDVNDRPITRMRNVERSTGIGWYILAIAMGLQIPCSLTILWGWFDKEKTEPGFLYLFGMITVFTLSKVSFAITAANVVLCLGLRYFFSSLLGMNAMLSSKLVLTVGIVIQSIVVIGSLVKKGSDVDDVSPVDLDRLEGLSSEIEHMPIEEQAVMFVRVTDSSDSDYRRMFGRAFEEAWKRMPQEHRDALATLVEKLKKSP